MAADLLALSCCIRQGREFQQHGYQNGAAGKSQPAFVSTCGRSIWIPSTTSCLRLNSRNTHSPVPAPRNLRLILDNRPLGTLFAPHALAKRERRAAHYSDQDHGFAGASSGGGGVTFIFVLGGGGVTFIFVLGAGGVMFTSGPGAGGVTVIFGLGAGGGVTVILGPAAGAGALGSSFCWHPADPRPTAATSPVIRSMYLISSLLENNDRDAAGTQPHWQPVQSS